MTTKKIKPAFGPTEFCEQCRAERPASLTEFLEVVRCAYCTGPSMDSYPTELGSNSAWVRERSGASKATSREYLVGLDQFGQAVYADEINNKFTVYAPKHGDDRLYPGLEEPVTDRSVRIRHSPAGPGPCVPSKDSFALGPRDDHLVLVDTYTKDEFGNRSVKLQPEYGVATLLEKSAEQWQALSEYIVDRIERNHRIEFDDSWVDDVVQIGGDN